MGAYDDILHLPTAIGKFLRRIAGKANPIKIETSAQFILTILRRKRKGPSTCIDGPVVHVGSGSKNELKSRREVSSATYNVPLCKK